MTDSVPCAVCDERVYLDSEHTKLKSEPVGHSPPPTTYRVHNHCLDELDEAIP